MNPLFQPHISTQKKHKKSKREERLIVTVSSFTNPKSNHLKFIEKHSFNYSIEVIVPYSSTLEKTAATEFVIAVQEDTGIDFYYEVEGSISLLLHQEFLEKYIKNKKGRFYALSKQIPSRATNKEHLNYSPSSTFGIISYGAENNSMSKLIIQLDKETYQQLGITGHPLPLYRNSTFYYIEIELSSNAFTPGKKYYERIVNLISQKLQISSFYCSWIVDGSSQEIFFPENCSSLKKNLDLKAELYSDRRIPDIRDVHIPMDRKITEMNQSFLEALYEWIGLFSIQSDLICHQEHENKFISNFDPNASLPFYSQSNFISSTKWRGFISPAFILKKLRKAQ